ncbi:hypothetical protein [Marinobacter sp. F4216]|uniref:hypothetical protein n=1 Tax=Marinobacter sp. F4216 TaxID=2874281 RepID=UPI001CBB9C62|nr:hypothetical protein [Marinobacter sp. F4216]MBZ2170175.1 hypothetical protein [Marinobacter sp. F4216]
MSQSSEVRVEDKTVHLVVLELHYHAELIKTLYEILQCSNFKITLVTLPSVFKKTALPTTSDDGQLSVYLKKDKESISDFMGRMDPVFRSADILYFNTIRHYWRELNELPFVATSMIRIHNAHCDFARFSHLHRPVINSLGILSHLIRKVLIGREWKLKAQVFEKIDYFMFANQTISDYVVNNGWVDQRKVLPPVLPFGYLGEKEYSADQKDTNTVTIAITGKVTNSKKDFNQVFQALEACLDALDYPIRLVLLGNAGQKHAKSIIRDFKSIESDKFSLDYSEGYVPSEVFEEKVAAVDFFIAPIQVDTHFRKYHEVYGKSKMSGIENDILIYRKPSLVVSQYRMSEPLDRVVGYFDPTPDSLASKIVEWTNNRTFEKVQSAFDNMDSYKRDVIAHNFYKLCREIM